MKPESDHLLLSTKLKTPAPRKGYVVRNALFDQLAKCAELGVIFICGGAGTGKTTLLSSFIREKDLPNVGWLSLDQTNINVYSFWLYFTAAVNTFLGDDGSLALMRSSWDATRFQDFLVMLINRLCADEDYYLVLDDVQLLTDPALIKTLEFFIESMPANLHLFMLSREEPPVYLGPLAVSGRLLFIDSKQMLLSPEEGLAFLRQTLGLSGSDQKLRDLTTYAEGWIGGLQLAAAVGGGKHKNPGGLLKAGGGIAAQYLTREIFESLSRQEQEFLVGTGFLSYFDAELCVGLFEQFTAASFSEMMDGLVRKNLFVICIDEPKGIYRYHNILAEYLAKQLSSLSWEGQVAKHRRAAQMFEQRGDLEEALKEFHAAKDHENMMRLIRTMGARIETLGYLNKIPLETLFTDLDLAAQCFIYNLGNLDEERSRLLYEKFERVHVDDDVFRALEFAQAYVAHDIACLPIQRALTAEQIAALPFGTMVKSFLLIGNSLLLLGQTEYGEAENCINKAIETNKGDNLLVEFFAWDQLAQIYEEVGRLNDSLACYHRLKMPLESPLMMSGMGVNYYLGLLGVHMLRMELKEADACLMAARDIYERSHFRATIADITLDFHRAEMEFLRGNVAEGADFVEKILNAHPDLNVLMLARLIHEMNCAGFLSPALARRFLADYAQATIFKNQPFMRLLRARILFSLGEVDEACSETEAILVFSRRRKNWLRLIGADLLKIQLLQAKKQSPGVAREIDNHLREAIYYAHKDKIFNPFYLERESILPLLENMAALAENQNPLGPFQLNFVQDLLALCQAAPTGKGPDDLSPRELEVLLELAKGITNKQIAANLHISHATVKTHVLSIYGKLGVSSRVMAVEEGRKKGLL